MTDPARDDHSAWLDGHIRWLVERGWWPDQAPVRRRPGFRLTALGTVLVLAFVTGVAMPRAYSVRVGSPPAASDCALPNYPNLNCVGIPAGTTLTHTEPSDYSTVSNNQVIDGWDIHGNLLVVTDNVTIRNSRIRGGVFNQFGGTVGTINAHPYTINDSEVGPDQCVDADSRIAGLQSGNLTARRVYIHDVDHGLDFSEPGNMDVQDSLITVCWLDETITPPDGSHVDGIQSLCGLTVCSGLTLKHNSIDDGPRCHGTFTINLVDPNLRGPVDVSDNLLWGACNYVIVTTWRSGTSFTVHNNRLVDGSWLPTLASVSAEGCAGQDWSGNYAATINGSATDAFTGPNTNVVTTGPEIACG